MEKRIIIVNGTPQSGKDTFADYIKKICIENNYYFNNISTVDHIKEIAKNNFNWDGVKDEKGRQLLSDLKNASIKYNDGPFKYIKSLISKKIYEATNKNTIFYFIIHCREISEIKKIKDYYQNNCITVFINRPFIETEKTCESDKRKNIQNYNYDYKIENIKDLQTFYNEIDVFVRKYLL